MTDAFRIYGPEELGADGYPLAWHRGVKHLVREQAGHRCVRCGHPYAAGAGEWSPCDDRCDHDGPIRALSLGGWVDYESTDDLGPLAVIDSVRVEARWRILTVHHLNGVKADLRWWNLAALCQRYLGEDLTRDEVEARLDELLALEAAA